MVFFRILLSIILVLAFYGCRGYISEDPPFHVNPNMDTQEKVKAYREVMRAKIDGTIAFGKLNADSHLYEGLVDGKPAKSYPKNLVIDEKFLKRGREVYNSKCSACHSHIGDGTGIVGKRLMVPPTSFHISRILNEVAPGDLFRIIKYGIRTMQPYGHIITNSTDIWSVVAYSAVLQISQDSNGAWIERSKTWWRQ